MFGFAHNAHRAADPLVLRFHAPCLIACIVIVAAALLGARTLGRAMGALPIALFVLYLALNVAHMWRWVADGCPPLAPRAPHQPRPARGAADALERRGVGSRQDVVFWCPRVARSPDLLPSEAVCSRSALIWRSWRSSPALLPSAPGWYTRA